MPHSAPLFSVVVPLFNRADTIAATIESLASDAPENLDLIIVDDGSSDASVQVATNAIAQAGFVRARIIQQENAGPGDARNTGVAHSNARFIAFIDSDDCWAPGTVALLDETLSRNAQINLLFLATRDITLGTELKLSPVHVDKVTTRNFRCFSHAALSRLPTRLASCNVVISKELLTALGGFRTDMPCSEDTDLFLRADNYSCMLIAEPPIVAHAVGDGEQLTSDPLKVQRGLDLMLQQERRGVYTGGRAMQKVLSNSVAHTIRIAFGAGRTGLAYKLYFRHLPRILSAGNWHWTIRLPLLPLLSVLRPGRYALK